MKIRTTVGAVAVALAIAAVIAACGGEGRAVILTFPPKTVAVAKRVLRVK